MVAAEQSRATAVAEKERGDREKIMADQEAKRALAAEESAKRAATMADQEAKRALAAEEAAKRAAAKADQEAKRALAAEESAKRSAGIAEQEAKRAGKAKKAANQAATMAEQETARAKAAETRADVQARRATEASELAEARLARSDYWVAQTKFRDNSISGGYQLLDNIPERYRNFEWHYDYNHFWKSRLSFRACNGTIERLRLRPDGKYFSAIGRNRLYLFETETGARVDIGKIDQKKVYDADKSSDSLPLDIYDADWSSDGKLFGVLRRHQIDFNDGTTLDFIKSIPNYVHTFDRIVFSPDAKSVYTYYRHALYPFSLATGEKAWVVKKPRAHILALVLSKDGSQLAVGRYGGGVQVYDSTNGELINEFETELSVSWLAFSPDGSMLAIPKGSNTLKVDLVNPTSGELIKSIDTENHYVAEVAFSPDGSRLLTAGLDARVNLWEVATGELLKSFSEHRYSINGLCWLHDGTGFISSDLAGYIHVTDMKPNEDDTILQQGEPALAISIRNSDGLIATGNGQKVNIHNSDEELLRSFDTHKKKLRSGAIV